MGFFFAENKKELLNYAPENKPTYINKDFTPYPLIDTIGNNEAEDPFHYALSGIKKIKANGNHEIGTHTFCHFYCHEHGQTVAQFDDDIKAAINIAKPLGIDIKSIVFPKNQMNPDDDIDKPYLQACIKHGITSFRGKEKSFIYNIHSTKKYRNFFIFKALKLLDAYVNLTGSNTYNLNAINKNSTIVNIPSSRLFRAYSSKLRFLESLKVKRITNAMKTAAKQNEMFHLWWHPHNFGANLDENFHNLETVFKAYKKLNENLWFSK